MRSSGCLHGKTVFELAEVRSDGMFAVLHCTNENTKVIYKAQACEELEIANDLRGNKAPR